MAINPTHAHLNTASPRYRDWMRVFRTPMVEIEAPAPIRAELPGLGVQPVYQLKLSALRGDQRARLLDHICTRFGLAIDEVVVGLARDGCPILAEDVAVSFDTRLVL